jgi:hypothetical protein
MQPTWLQAATEKMGIIVIDDVEHKLDTAVVDATVLGGARLLEADKGMSMAWILAPMDNWGENSVLQVLELSCCNTWSPKPDRASSLAFATICGQISADSPTIRITVKTAYRQRRQGVRGAAGGKGGGGHDTYDDASLLRLNRGDRYTLHKRFINFTTDNVLCELKRVNAVVGRHGNTMFSELLNNPVDWGTRSPNGSDEAEAAAAQYRNGNRWVPMTTSQDACFDRILKHRLHVVWGPPGSGKVSKRDRKDLSDQRNAVVGMSEIRRLGCSWKVCASLTV